ncbi:MAG TPA: sulfotransferase [Nocardioidaceae bacterium]|nr:sulfotransferase [Nocardioidaceae bacterium]
MTEGPALRGRALAKRAATGLVPPVRRLIGERDALRADVARLERRVRRLESTQRAYGDYDYVFVMAYGRSGSTLLQAILNSTPGVLMRGENRGLPYYLHQFHKSAVKDAAWAGDVARRKVNPFFGIRDYPADLAITRIRELLLDTVLRPEPGTKMLGFKEIRWYQDDLPEYLAFMQQVFPGARFILNTRKLDDVATSSWWADDPEAQGRLEDIESRMLSAAKVLGPSVFHVRYDEYVDDPSSLRPLFEWLGLAFDETRVRKVMERRYAEIPGAAEARAARVESASADGGPGEVSDV